MLTSTAWADGLVDNPGESGDPQRRPGALPALLGALLVKREVKVLFFASLREKLGTGVEEVELPDRPARSRACACTS